MRSLFCCSVLLLSWTEVLVADNQSLNLRNGYVTEAGCKSCHEAEAEAWSKSHHRHAMEKANPETVLADFNDTEFEHNGVVSRFFKEGKEYLVEITEKSGKTTRREVKYTFGYFPAQQYLIQGENGALQAYDVAWDVRTGNWYKLTPEIEVEPVSRFHWSGGFYRWNANCADCHSTDVQKNFNLKDLTYDTKWSNITVGCQACHGPAEKHMMWMSGGQDKARKSSGFSVSLSKLNKQEQIEICAPCHSRRSKIVANADPLEKYDDQFVLALLRDGLYHPDGQIDDEVYVYGSFLQSKMHLAGVTCGNCHDPHLGEVSLEGDSICTQCHSPNANPEFPTAAGDFGEAHHKHTLGEAAPKCVDCHMSAKTYMEVDDRRDHSFRVPRPDVSKAYNTPNACLTCHDNKDHDWSLEAVKKWYPEGHWKRSHFAQALSAGRNGDADAYVELSKVIRDKSHPAIVRATAISMLPLRPNQETAEMIQSGLSDPSPLVRHATLSILQPLETSTRWSVASPLLEDPVRSVRIEAARIFADAPIGILPDADQQELRKASDEFVAGRLHESDLTDSLVQLALYLSQSGEVDLAEENLQTALRNEPDDVRAALALANLYRGRNEIKKEAQILKLARQRQPDDANVLLASALHEVRAGNRIAGIEYLEKAFVESPQNIDVGYTLAVGLFGEGDDEKAIEILSDMLKNYPRNERLLFTLATFYRDIGKTEEALNVAHQLKKMDKQNASWDALEKSIKDN